MHPEIDNPEYVEDKELYKYSDIGSIGFDLWQVGKMYCVLDRIVLFLTKFFLYCDASQFGFTPFSKNGAGILKKNCVHLLYSDLVKNFACNCLKKLNFLGPLCLPKGLPCLPKYRFTSSD